MLARVDWERFVEAARAIGTVAYLGTADDRGVPHVAAVMPGFLDGRLWFVTRTASKKYRNLGLNPAVALHWPVSGPGPGELAAWGTATLHADEAARHRLWGRGIVDYDLDAFFGGPDRPGVGIVEVAVDRARLLGPDFRADVYTPGGPGSSG
jgi:general stress protein 26